MPLSHAEMQAVICAEIHTMLLKVQWKHCRRQNHSKQLHVCLAGPFHTRKHAQLHAEQYIDMAKAMQQIFVFI